ncbi:MAG: Uma2 family endonuclease [Armatimonadetes bacterium]|nr:Uma2 family endonuclease [Armatimonadota bacterium]
MLELVEVPCMTLVTRKWTRAEYEKMIEIGLLSEDERVELIRGEIVALSPIDPLHASTVDQANRLLNAKYGGTYVVRVQNPILVGEDAIPQPDLVVIEAVLAAQLVRERRHPSTAELVIEVANTSLAYDRGEKGSLYASAHFPLYWIVNLVHEVLEVYSQPSPDPTTAFGWSYATRHRLSRGQTVEFASLTLAVSDFLPPVD